MSSVTQVGDFSPSLQENVLEIRDLSISYDSFRASLSALRHVNLKLGLREIVAIVGESGCGKSTLGLALIRLLASPPARVTSGEIIFQQKDVLKLDESEMARLRGTGISMIFQDPLSSLDPVNTVGKQIMESIEIRERRRATRDFGPYDSRPKTETVGTFTRTIAPSLPRRSPGRRSYSAEAIDALKKVQIADAERVLHRYPHELSGGMAQRVMIAQALIEKPSVLIADEPTSALDVTTQAQVLALMRDLREEIGASIIFITHDLAVAAQIADRVVVMYAGEIAEIASAQKIFQRQLHPYTEGLVSCFPSQFKDEGKLEAIGGELPDLRNPPSGCLFHPRCKYAFEKCHAEHPMLRPVEDHDVACFLRY